MKNNKIIPFIPAVFCMVIIFWFSAQNASTSSDLSGGFIRNILGIFWPGFDEITVEDFQFFVRKSAHFIIYMTLGALTYFGFKNIQIKKSVRCLSSIIVCILYSVSDEVHQTFISGRSGQISDVVLDSIGSIAGIGICFLFLLIYKKNRIRKENKIKLKTN